mmetsp:Transcript_32632/g.71099  ORF Transcript_32632/g.71099 Transcript_32632/m.71099 type:complete len:290 (-) Transcript_32632:9-878(-)
MHSWTSLPALANTDGSAIEGDRRMPRGLAALKAFTMACHSRARSREPQWKVGAKLPELMKGSPGLGGGPQRSGSLYPMRKLQPWPASQAVCLALPPVPQIMGMNLCLAQRITCSSTGFGAQFHQNSRPMRQKVPMASGFWLSMPVAMPHWPAPDQPLAARASSEGIASAPHADSLACVSHAFAVAFAPMPPLYGPCPSSISSWSFLAAGAAAKRRGRPPGMRAGASAGRPRTQPTMAATPRYAQVAGRHAGHGAPGHLGIVRLADAPSDIRPGGGGRTDGEFSLSRWRA